VTLLAYFVVAAVPLGLLALFSLCAHKPEADSVFLDGKDMRWWEPGACLLILGGMFVGPLLLLFGVAWILGWAFKTIGWIA
jgi:hypothetical protein